MERNVEIISDMQGEKIVYVNDIRFKGKRNVNWEEVKAYLKEYIDEFYIIEDTDDCVYIGNDLPDEYAGSRYTYSLKGTNAKAKANAAQGIPELLKIAKDKKFRNNMEEKHRWNAKYGWYKYKSRFALPVYNEQDKIERYNIFSASMLIRHANDGKLYLYDIIDIKKETSNPLEP